MKGLVIGKGSYGDITITENEVPESWDELTPRQLLAYVRIANSSRSEQMKRIEIMYHLLNLPALVFYGIEMETVMNLWSRMEFLQKPPFITRNIIKGFWHRGVYYLGPETGFDNTQVLETGWWDKFFIDYHKSKSPRDLDLAIACMFRPVHVFKKMNPFHMYSDYRVAFNMASVEKRADKFAHLDPHLKQAIWLQFAGIRQSFELNYPNVYSKKEGSSAADKFGFLSLIIDLAGPKFGDVKQVESKNWTVVLSHIEISEKRAKQTPKTTDGNQTQVFT